MGRQLSISSFSEISDHDFFDVEELECPFGNLDNLEESDLPGIAYEIFFMSCRSSLGFSSKTGHVNPSSPAAGAVPSEDGGAGERVPVLGQSGSMKRGTGLMAVNSKLKKALGLKTRKTTPMRALVNQSSGSGAPSSPGRARRPMTSAEIMRLQMRVTEHSDGRLRKTLMRTFVGQIERRAETVILPLELLRQLKLSEFSDTQEYHQWQVRQLKVLEAGLLLHPSIPVDKQNPAALRLKEIVRASEIKAIDTSKNSEAMRSLCESVAALAWRTPNGAIPGEACHWADGYPMNIHIYIALLESIFDHREETVVLDEVDELVELMKKTWTTLGINRIIHNLCFAWVMFKRYIVTVQVEPDLLSATLTMLVDVSNDAKKAAADGGEPIYMKALSSAMGLMQFWAEKRMLDYHDYFHDHESVSHMEHLLNLALSATKIISEDLPSASRVDYYIRSSMRNAFSRIMERGAAARSDCLIVEVEEDPGQMLVQIAKETEQLANSDKEIFSQALKNWHPVPTAVAAMTVHNCYGIVLQQYLGKVTVLTNELVKVLQAAAKLEDVLVQMVLDDAGNSEDGGKAIVREMVPYEVDNLVVALLKTWIEERLKIGNEYVLKAKETESWMPKSKSEPFAESAMDMMKLAKVTVDEFFEIPLGSRDAMVQVLAKGLEVIFQEYIAFVSQCGTKQNYLPSLPSLTRCNQDSRFVRLWKKATLRFGGGAAHSNGDSSVVATSDHPRPSTSRGTQRLYIRLNTLHYILAHLHALGKSLSLFSRSNSSVQSSGRFSNSGRRFGPNCHFEAARGAVQTAIEHVSEVAAYRLIFLDSHHSFYEGLYMGVASEARIRPALRVLKQNLTLLVSILTDRAQPLAVREVMRAAFDTFLMVLLAGGNERAFQRSDFEMVMEDFRSLKKVFCTSGEEGLVAEDVVDREAEMVEGIVALMGLPTERLIEDFCIAACEASGIGGMGAATGQKVPMPPTTGRWNRTDPNTILRVLCHRDDEAANQFLKRMFQLAKRR